MFYQIVLALLFLLTFSFAALPECDDGVSCPTGGIWSEWTTTDTCDTVCGSCSKIYYKRNCLSEKSNCNCTGNTTRYLPCNTKSCIYPAQRSCCIPYVPMVINGTMQCGPLPKTPTSTKNSSCCPKDGMWSEWSGFSLSSGQWTRTRECLSESAGCSCNGNSIATQSTCPCSAMKTAQQVANSCAGSSNWLANNMIRDEANCAIKAHLVASNDVIMDACVPHTTYTPYTFVPHVLFSSPIDPSTPCHSDDPFDCEARKQMNPEPTTLDISFTCDLDTLQWIYEYDGTVVDGYVQIWYPR